ncbi:MAG TPA: ABC transporter permease [Candidatus Acidoferrum sp.]|nr:ABC transporter permease [Candidatus Acidoferrum sp.]
MLTRIKAHASRIRSWISRRQVDQEFEHELDTHLNMLTDENIRKGMAPEQARRAARVRLGGHTQLTETNRELRGLPMLETFFQDTRFAFRMLRKNPGFTAVAVLTLALGIGANTAIFSVVYAVLLKPLPFTNPDQLFTAFQANTQKGIAETGCSYPNFEEWRAQNHVFSELAGVLAHQLTLTGRGEPSVVHTSVVTPELFALLDVKPLAGRIFFPQDGKQGAPPVVLVSEDLWRGRFGADPQILGTSIDLDKRPFIVVGIIPAAFRTPFFNAKQEVWIPLVQDPVFSPFMPQRGVHLLPVLVRLKAGVSVAQAQAEMDAISGRLAAEFPAENSGWTVRLVPLQKEIVGDVRTELLVLLGAVGLVLLIACANIANLLLTRATSRSKEIAVRTALGAGRVRIIRQLLSETAVLGLLGGAVGVALAYWGVKVLSSLLPSSLPQMNPIRVDYFVLGFALLLSAIAGVVFGLAPAMSAANADIQTTLREGARSGESRNRRRTRSLLAVAEISLAMVLLVTAGLLLRSFARLTSVSPGFDAQHIVKADISLPQFEYSTPQQWAEFSEELLARIQSDPGLQDSAVVVPRPIADNSVKLPFDIVGNPPSSAGASRTASYVSVSPDYFRVMGIPLLAGRVFNQHDNSSAPRVSIISEAMARLYFPNQDPLGKQITFGFPRGSAGATREIIGIVGNVRDVSLGQSPGPMMYVPFAQAPLWGANLVVKSTLSTSSLAATIRQEVQRIDKDLPVTDVAKMPDLIDASVAQPRFRMFLLGLFAVMALVLAATGIFGVISYSVSRRTNEIGIRVALGASRNTILSMILREILILTLAGLAVGLPCALAASHLVGHMLFNVSANDPATLAAVAFVLAAVAALAGYIPARRAMRVDPMVALRYE